VPGAGAAGGLGAWLIALGASVRSGAEVVIAAHRLDELIAGCDLVVTGEGKSDAGSLRGKVVGSIAARASQAGKPCVVISGQVELGRREAAAHGIDETFSCTELAGSVEASMAEPGRWIRVAAGQAARSWSTSRA
jgi:glycerate kinase